MSKSKAVFDNLASQAQRYYRDNSYGEGDPVGSEFYFRTIRDLIIENIEDHIQEINDNMIQNDGIEPSENQQIQLERLLRSEKLELLQHLQPYMDNLRNNIPQARSGGIIRRRDYVI